MSARYLVRLDDACPTMDQRSWDAIERILDDLKICPLVAVVPDNRDPALICGTVNPAFWSRVREWEAKGWTIAMHGLHHVYHHVNPKRLILPFYNRSEFAGLSLSEQAALIARSWAQFLEHGVAPTAWIAPSHAFDRTTVMALARATPIRLISDGLSIEPYEEDGFRWVPQQLWAPAPRRNGVWTICLHPNTMSDKAIETIRETLSQSFYRDRIMSVADLPDRLGKMSVKDHLYRRYFLLRHHLVPVILPLYHAARRVWRLAAQ